MQFIFTANPEDYTNRGSIVTPLKDRIGSQILTHYPETIEVAKTITSQESALDERQSSTVLIPELAKDILEQIVFEARKSEYVDVKSGVSARLSITAFENLVSAAERRLLHSGDDKTIIRMSDFIGIIPAITGKIELVYEGEQEGAYSVALTLLGSAIKTLYSKYFPKVQKIEKQGIETPYDEIVSWFFNNSDDFEILDDIDEQDYKSILEKVKPLSEFVKKHIKGVSQNDLYFWQEFVLWSLVEYKKLSKYRYAEGVQFKDPYGNFISGL
jgi:magnesium chelatase subunit I